MERRFRRRIRHQAHGVDLDADLHAVVSVNTGGTAMSEQDFRALTREELEALAGEQLPEKAAMSLINANVAVPVNVAAALNVLSDGSTAAAIAEQTGDITQGI